MGRYGAVVSLSLIVAFSFLMVVICGECKLVFSNRASLGQHGRACLGSATSTPPPPIIPPPPPPLAPPRPVESTYVWEFPPKTAGSLAMKYLLPPAEAVAAGLKHLAKPFLRSIASYVAWSNGWGLSNECVNQNISWVGDWTEDGHDLPQIKTLKKYVEVMTAEVSKAEGGVCDLAHVMTISRCGSC